MSVATTADRPRGRGPLALLLFAALLALCIFVARPISAGAAAGGALVAEPVLSATAAGARQLFGPSPVESPGEVWGVGKAASERVHIIRYTDAGAWEAVPDPVDSAGNVVRLPSGGIPLTANAGRTTPSGGLATLVELSGGETPVQDLIVRDPGGPLRAVASPAEPLLLSSEHLFGNESSPRIRVAAVEEPGGKTGAFVVPDPGPGLNTGVLHYDGDEWTSREPICLDPAPECKPLKATFNVLSIEANAPDQAWMLARQPGQQAGIILLRREVGPEGGVWRKQALGGSLGAIFAKREPTVSGVRATIAPREAGQPLTVTSNGNGVWVDATVTVRGSPSSDATLYFDVASGAFTASWCDLPPSTPEPARAELCTFSLGSELPAGEGRSFAWAGSGAPGDFGTRAITGVGLGAMLIFENGAFSRIPLSGNGGSSAGAALSAPDLGWLGPSLRLTREPVPSGLQAWPVPFRRPLLAITPQPGAPVGALTSQALAVGAAGEVARYLPGVGWQPESLLSGSGSRATPNLRGVAWPKPNYAYAVGDEGAMWLWRANTGLWESDPGAPPNLIRGNFTGIAFDPNEPERGYAVGKQGLLLRYGKRWTQDQLPAGLNPEINITSIAFAASEALATWSLAVRSKVGAQDPEYIGGLIVNDGSGWRVEEGAAAALAELEQGLQGFAPRRVAGLPDGGAVIAGFRGGVIERDAAGAPWHAVPGALLGYPAAVAAVREGGQLRAILSVGSSLREQGSDRAQALAQPPEGQAPLLTEPYPLPESGYLIRQTATGWQDEERQSYPSRLEPTNQKSSPEFDLPREPDPVLATLISPDGTQGWAVGGQTGENAPKELGPFMAEGLQTAAAMRYGPAALPPSNSSSAPISVPAGEATFAIGGGAQCKSACADLVNTGIGPDVWLRAAVARAASIGGLRAFLYAGPSVSSNLDLTKVSPRAFAAEEAAYASRLGSEAGALPVFAAPAESDRYESSLATFGAQFDEFPAPLGLGAGAGVTPIDGGNRAAGNYSYSFDSSDAVGANVVRVVVLDNSMTPLSGENLCWLGGQLARARLEAKPAIVVGNREVGSEEALRQILVTGTSTACPQAAPGGASAFFYDTEGNTASSLSWGQATIPAYGTGTLGYLRIPETRRQELVPASGFLLASVNVAARSTTTNIAPVSVRLIPSIGSLAVNALDGTLLRRSQTALFEALARRPIAGIGCGGVLGEGCVPSPDPYIQIPARCVSGRGYQGRSCANEIAPEYRFSSSRPDIADFVKVDPNSSNRRSVLLSSSGKTTADPTSGLLCAFNSGTTVVSVETGGLSYSLPVTVQKGSVQRPCGTVPRTDLVAATPPINATPPPAPTNQPQFKNPPGSLPPPPPPASTPTPVPTPTPVAQPVVKVPPKVPVPPPAPFFAPTPSLTPLVVIVPPPPAPSVQPTPPSGTSPVTQPATSPEPEEEEEAAFDLVHHMAALESPRPRPVHWAPTASSVARNGGGSQLLIYGLPALVLIAAVASAGGARRRRPPELVFENSAPRRRRSA